MNVTNDEIHNPSDSGLKIPNVMATSMDSDWKMLKAETALLMITSVHESWHCFTQVSVTPNAEPSVLSSWTRSTLSLCSSAMPHWTIHHSIVISSYNIACILRTVHYTENQSTATIKACIIRYCTAIIHSWIVSYDMAEFHIWNSLKQKPLAPPHIITTINAAMSWCLHFLGILKELFKPKINTLPSFTHPHVTHINTK